MSSPSSASDEPLLGGAPARGPSAAASWYAFLEGRTDAGARYEALTVVLIIANVVAFVVGTLYVAEYSPDYASSCSKTCDAIFFGNDDDNGLAGTSVVEIVTVAVFTVDFALRFYCAGEASPSFHGGVGRLRFVCTFFSVVDLVSIVPFYVDFFVPGNLPASQFLRMFRLLRMMKMEGRYVAAFTLIDDVVREQKAVLSTAMFVGMSTWVICSSFYYIAEHRSTLSIYCGAAAHCNPDTVDTSACTFDSWGFVNCTSAGCPGTEDTPHPCWNLFQSIPGAMYFTLVNLFGEFPLIDQHSVWGKVVGTVVAVFAVAVFAIPAGIIGNGFEDLLARRREIKQEGDMRHELGDKSTGDQGRSGDSASDSTTVIVPNLRTFRGRLYAFMNARTSVGGAFEKCIFVLIFATTLSFMVETSYASSTSLILGLEYFELVAVIVFTFEYTARMFAVGEDPRYAGTRGRLRYACTFFALVDLASVLPYWIDLVSTTARGGDPFLNTDASSTFVRCLRLLRILKAEKYTQAFTVFDDVILANSEVLVVTGFSALVMWILFSALMYFAERDNSDPSMSEYYNTVPNAMWMTLLNLSGESPLCHYSGFGKVLQGIIGVFATGLFGIPIGLLGAGFEEWIDENDQGSSNGAAENNDDMHNALFDGAPNRIIAGTLGSLSSIGSGRSGATSKDPNGEDIRRASWDAQGVLSDIPAARRSGMIASGDQTSVHANAVMQRDTSCFGRLALFLEGGNTFVPSKLLPTGNFGFYFEMLIFVLIFLTVGVGILETVDSLNCDDARTATAMCRAFQAIEWVAVIIFTVEYALRFMAAPQVENLERGKKELERERAELTKTTEDDDALNSEGDCCPDCTSWMPSRLAFVFSFYAIVDLLAILPFYLAEAFPGSWVDQNDEYFRMLRLLRLLKLDKYVPSISLIDDVFRLKRSPLIVTGFAAATLWVLFSALQYMTEHDAGVYAYPNALDDPLPLYGCDENCTMAVRFRSVIDTLTYTCVHLTGDYPIVTYNFWGRTVCFFMVLAAVGVVSIPSGLIASGFAQIVKSKAKLRRIARGDSAETNGADEDDDDDDNGDGYFERQYAKLKDIEAPAWVCTGGSGSLVDRLQVSANGFLNGHEVRSSNNASNTVETQRTSVSTYFRALILVLIVTNIAAVILETIPYVDQLVGNAPGNFFDAFEAISVTVFLLEYLLRLFSVVKDRNHLYSVWFYATTFFGVVDLLACAPYFAEQILLSAGAISRGGDSVTIFRLFRIFRILQLEHFVVAFTVLDNVFRASRDVLKATGLMALIIWVGCGALFFIFEQNNPNWRSCDDQIPLHNTNQTGCFDFSSTAACNTHWGEGVCSQSAFVNMPDALYYTAVFLGGEWGKVDFTWGGRCVCVFLCIVGIAIYAIPIGTLFDSFGAVLGMGGDDDEDEDER
jgi:hypothetical protein